MRTDEVIAGFDTAQHMYDLKSEIDELTVAVRGLRKKHAEADYNVAVRKLMTAREYVQQMSKAPHRPLTTPLPRTKFGT